jgi:hypothetical protein
VTSPLVAYNFDEVGNTVVNYGTASGGDFSISGASVTRVAGHTDLGLRSTGSTPAVLPDIGRTAQRTVMGWLSFAGIPTSWPLLCNVAALDSGGWGILYLSPDIAIQARNNVTFVRASATWPVDGQPHHGAGTYDGTAVRLYLDGVQQGPAVAITGPLRTDTEPPVLWSGTGAMASGYIDDLRIYDVALSQAEIVVAMNTPVTAPAAPDPEPEPEPEPTPAVPLIAASGGWNTLLNIIRTSDREREERDSTPPVACPNDGEPLREDPNGQLRCPWDGWIWDGLPIRY